MSNYTITDADRKFAAGFTGRGADRWYRAFFARFDARETLTEGQRGVLDRAREHFLGMVGGVRVRNRYPSCWMKGCRETMTVAVDGRGYCVTHGDEKRKESRAAAAMRKAATEEARAAWDEQHKRGEASSVRTTMLDLLDEAG